MGGQTGYDPTAPVREFTSTWLRSSRHFSRGVGNMYRSIAAANRALIPTGETANGTTDAVDADRRPPAAPEIAFSRPDWETERTTDDWTKLGVGDVVRFTKQIEESDVADFARVSGDTNLLHLDQETAERTRFGGRIVHGTLASGLISAALARLPGLTIYLSQDLEFLQPVDVGDRLTAVVEIVEDIGNGRYRLTTVVTNEDGDPVIDGEAVVIVDAPPEA